MIVPSSDGPKVAMIFVSVSGLDVSGSIDCRKAWTHNGSVSASVPSRSNITPLIFFIVQRRLQRSDPDILKADRFAGITMRLQFDRAGAMGLVERFADIAGAAFQFKMVLYQYAVVDHRNISGCGQAAIRLEHRRRPDDIIRLPLTGLAAGIGQRYGLLVDAAHLSVDIGLVVIVVQYLQLITVITLAGAGEEDTAIATRLVLTGDIGGDLVFDVQLVVGEGFFGLYITGLFVHRYSAILHVPFRSAAIVDGYPLIQVLAIEEVHRIGGSFPT